MIYIIHPLMNYARNALPKKDYMYYQNLFVYILKNACLNIRHSLNLHRIV